MATLVATGQITIVDANDARPITAVIVASGSVQQVYTKDESSVSYVPDWTSTPLVLTPKVYVGASGASLEVAASLTNKKWSTDLSTSLAATTTFTRNTNLTAGAAPVTYYFEGDYADPVTQLTSHIVCQITLSQIKTGTNAVYVLVRGKMAIEEATGSTKSTARVVADLVRAGGVDDTGVTYRWFQSPHAAADQVDGNLAGVTTKYGLQDTAAANANRAGVIGQYQTGSGSTTAAISTSNVPDGGWVDAKAVIISETAITDMMVYKVEVKDSDATVYQQFFTVYDVSDPYTLEVISTSGDKFQNGNGTTTLYPKIYYGAGLVGDTTGWTFTWTPYDKDGLRCGFVDTTRTAQADGRTVSANTAGAASSITYGGTGITVAVGDVVKLQRADGTAGYYEVGVAGSASPLVLRAPTTNTWLAFATPVASEFTRLFICTSAGQRTTSGGAGAQAGSFTYTGYETDFKANIIGEAYRP